MGRNAKVGIAAAVVVVLAAITFAMKLQLAMIAVVIIGGAIIFILLQQEDDDDGGSTKTKPTKSKTGKAKTGKARLDEILDDKASKSGGASTATRAPGPVTPPSGGLPTWTPGSVDSGEAEDEDADTFGPAETDSSWDTWEKEWPADADTLILEEDDPLASLDRLDDIDPVAEVERLDAADDPFASLRADIEVEVEDDTFELDELDDLTELDDEPVVASSGSAFSFTAAPAVINEEVSTADDIMAASTATELHVEDAGDSELARLLAKVQARLSAYE